MDALVQRIRRGDRRSLAKAMSLVEEPGPQARALRDRLRRSTGQVPWWGFTGPPGAGKSTVIDCLLTLLRGRGRRVGVVAVDPTSPVSEGALLGDRVRMMRHAVDPDVFIRSLATHHCEGGLSDATLHCVRLLELAGYDPLVIETVGVGQNEVDLACVADLCVVVLGPGYGDDIQLIKAGLLEIADLVVVNKCDLPGAGRLLEAVRRELEPAWSAASAAPSSPGVPARPPGPTARIPAAIDILAIEANSGKGVEKLLEKLLQADRAARNPERRRRQRRRQLLREIRRSAMVTYQQTLGRRLAAPETDELIARLERGELSLDAVVARLAASAPADRPTSPPGADHRADP